MPTSEAQAEWHGNLPQGEGKMSFGNGAWEGPYTAASRFETGEGTNPEALIAAAHAGCFSMAFANVLSQAGYEPKSVRTTARVSVEKDDGGFSITRSELSTEADVDGLDEAKFQEHAEEAKQGCPVSRALAAIEIRLDARLGQA